MNTAVNEPVSVLMVFDKLKNSVMPKKIKWRGREYLITKLGYHHKIKIGNTLMHIFSVCTDSVAFKLQLNTDNLHWILEEVYDSSAA